MTNYEKYQLQWLIEHGYSIEYLIQEIANYQNAVSENDKSSTLVEDFKDWEFNSGFSQEMWACEEEWKQSEGKES